MIIDGTQWRWIWDDVDIGKHAKKLSSDVMMLILENMQRKLSSDMVQLVLWCTKGGITLANLNQRKFQVIHDEDKDDYLVQNYYDAENCLWRIALLVSVKHNLVDFFVAEISDKTTMMMMRIHCVRDHSGQSQNSTSTCWENSISPTFTSKRRPLSPTFYMILKKILWIL